MHRKLTERVSNIAYVANMYVAQNFVYDYRGETKCRSLNWNSERLYPIYEPNKVLDIISGF